MKLSKLHQDQRKRRKKRKKKEREEEEENSRQISNAAQQNIIDQSHVMPDRGPNTDMKQYASLDRAF